MTDTNTTLLQLVKQTIGGNDNAWGEILNTNFDKIDTAIGGTSTKGITSGGSVTLSDDEARASTYILTGTANADSNVIVPTRVRIFAVRNLCTGGSSVKVKTASGTGIIVPRNRTSILVCDGTNVDFMRNGGDVPIGGMISCAGEYNTDWASNWLKCDGSLISRSTYDRLFTAIGTRWNVGDGSTTFGLPSTGDRYNRGGTEAQIGTYLSEMIGAHNHAFTTDLGGGVTPSGTVSSTLNTGGNNIGYGTDTISFQGGGTSKQGILGTLTPGSGITISSSFTGSPLTTHTHTGTTNNNSGTENRPATFTTLQMIRFQ